MAVRMKSLYVNQGHWVLRMLQRTRENTEKENVGTDHRPLTLQLDCEVFDWLIADLVGKLNCTLELSVPRFDS